MNPISESSETTTRDAKAKWTTATYVVGFFIVAPNLLLDRYFFNKTRVLKKVFSMRIVPFLQCVGKNAGFLWKLILRRSETPK